MPYLQTKVTTWISRHFDLAETDVEKLIEDINEDGSTEFEPTSIIQEVETEEEMSPEENSRDATQKIVDDEGNVLWANNYEYVVFDITGYGGRPQTLKELREDFLEDPHPITPEEMRALLLISEGRESSFRGMPLTRIA